MTRLPLSAFITMCVPLLWSCGPVVMCRGWEWQGSVWAVDVRRQVEDVKQATGHGDTAHMGIR